MLHFDFPGPGKDVSYHNHSNLSDGASSLGEMCRAAKAAGLREFGMSDHWVIPPPEIRDVNWRMEPERLEYYVTELQRLKKELDSESFTLRIGLEVDFFFENASEVVAELKDWPFDYLIGSVHYSGTFPVDHDASDWAPLSPGEIETICEEYWRKLEGAALSGFYTFIGHPDLPKKFGYVPEWKYLPHAVRLLDAVRKTCGAIELNTSGWFKPCKEQYPAGAILKEACARRIPVVINADAHAPAHVARNFDEAAQVLFQAGYPAR